MSGPLPRAFLGACTGVLHWFTPPLTARPPFTHHNTHTHPSRTCRGLLLGGGAAAAASAATAAATATAAPAAASGAADAAASAAQAAARAAAPLGAATASAAGAAVAAAVGIAAPLVAEVVGFVAAQNPAWLQPGLDPAALARGPPSAEHCASMAALPAVQVRGRNPFGGAQGGFSRCLVEQALSKPMFLDKNDPNPAFSRQNQPRQFLCTGTVDGGVKYG